MDKLVFIKDMRIELKGRPISKKRNYLRGKSGGLYLSKTWKVWEEDALWQLKGYKTQFTGEVYIDYEFYLKGQLSADGDNLEAGINDLLEASGIIKNDKLIMEHSTKKIPDNKEWSTILEIRNI